jgi:hypothetical protein
MSTNPEVRLQPKTFSAWINNLPGPGREPTLIVTGKTELITESFQVTLVQRSPQGINPKILELEVHVIKPSGPVILPVTEKEVRYEATPVPIGEYTDVHIDNGDDSFSISIGVAE